MNTQALYLKMIYLFGIILIGFIGGKLGYMTPELNKNISRLVTFVTSPMLVLSSVLKPGNHPIKNLTAIKFLGIAFIVYAVLILCALILPRILKPTRKQEGCYQYLFIFSNISFMGFPVIDALFGEEYRFYATLFVMAFDVLCWTYGVALISGEKITVNKDTFLKPAFLATVVAIILYLTSFSVKIPPLVGEKAYGTFYDIVNNIGNITSVLAMLIIGCSLAKLSFKQVFGRWQIYVLTLLKMIVFPVICWFVFRMFIKDQMTLGVITVIVSMPAATNATIISYQFGGDEKLASSGVFLTTLVSAVTVPVLMSILF